MNSFGDIKLNVVNISQPYRELVEKYWYAEHGHTVVNRLLCAQQTTVGDEQLCVFMTYSPNKQEFTEIIIEFNVEVLPRISFWGTHGSTTTFDGNGMGNSSKSTFQRMVYLESFRKASRMLIILSVPSISPLTFVPNENSIRPFVAPSASD